MDEIEINNPGQGLARAIAIPGELEIAAYHNGYVTVTVHDAQEDGQKRPPFVIGLTLKQAMELSNGLRQAVAAVSPVAVNDKNPYEPPQSG